MSTPDAGWLSRVDRTGAPLLLARLVLGGVFVWFGLLKVGDPVGFLKTLREFAIVPDGNPWLLNTLAGTLPWFEIWCGLLLLFGVAVRGTALALLVMLAVFTPAIAHRGLGLASEAGRPLCEIAFDCGCGTGVVNVCSKLAQNAGLLLLAGVALLSRSRALCLRRDLFG